MEAIANSPIRQTAKHMAKHTNTIGKFSILYASIHFVTVNKSTPNFIRFVLCMCVCVHELHDSNLMSNYFTTFSIIISKSKK